MTSDIKYERIAGGFDPRLSCGTCGKPIELAQSGVDSHAKVLWDDEGRITFMHQMCDDDSYPYWQSIEIFFRNLLHNTGLTPKKLAGKDPFEDVFGVISIARKKGKPIEVDSGTF